MKKPRTRIFKMILEAYKPFNPQQPCNECVLESGIFMCLDRKYCEFKKTGMTWKKGNRKMNIYGDGE